MLSFGLHHPRMRRSLRRARLRNRPGQCGGFEVIPGSRQNPKILWVYDTEVVGDGIAELQPVFWDFLA